VATLENRSLLHRELLAISVAYHFAERRMLGPAATVRMVKSLAAKRHSHRQDANSRAVIRSGVFTASVITKPRIVEGN
jgi:hypothetical protein